MSKAIICRFKAYDYETSVFRTADFEDSINTLRFAVTLEFEGTTDERVSSRLCRAVSKRETIGVKFFFAPERNDDGSPRTS